MKPQGADSTGEDQADVAVGQSIDLDGLADRLFDLLVAVGRLQPELAGGGPHPSKMGVQLEDATVVDPDALETTITVEQAMIHDTDSRVFRGHELSINPDLHRPNHSSD